LDKVNQEFEMAKKYVENTGDSPLWVSGSLIAPGEGREVDVPDEAVATAKTGEPDLIAPLRELLAGTVAAVAASLEGLSTETLNQLQELENASAKPRKGVLEALANARISLADAKLKGEDLGADGAGDPASTAPEAQ
jgi:hypothetical protein